MRHRYGLRKLNRISSHHPAMLRNISNSLLQYKLIKTTMSKVKELHKAAEPLTTLAKKGTVANHRLALAHPCDRGMVTKLSSKLGPRFATHLGDYTRILKLGFHQGDNVPMVLAELLDHPEVAEAVNAEAATE